MPSCSNSSNISASINAISVVQGGSRLEAEVSFVSGLTIGNVIRYDVPSAGYTASRANGPAESEVFGVIEGFNDVTNKYTVVIYGSINLPTSKLSAIEGGTGGSGGNDIYFLSGTTAGQLQNLAPDNLTHIIKPVYQVAPHGSYSGVVVNYLGYRVGGEIESVLEDTELGNIQLVVGNTTFTDGYVDAARSYQLPITDYSEFYSKYGTQYGYVEKVTVDSTISPSVIPGMRVSQPGTPVYTGEITYVDYGNKYIYISRLPDTSLASTNKVLTIDTLGLSYNLTSTSIYAVYSPIITLTQPLEIRGNNTIPSVTQKTYVGIKVKPQGVKVTIPKAITTPTLTATELILGTGASNVESILNDFESRITVIENRLHIP